MRKDTHLSSSILRLLLLCALVATSASLPASISLANASPVRAFNATPTSTGQTPLGTRIPFYYQDIGFIFTNFGKTIPEIEVKDTLGGADLVAQYYLENYPQQAIPDNRFEYRLPQGNVILAITTGLGNEITWRQLYRMLQALNGFMVESKPPVGPHYQSLNFDIEIRGKKGWTGNGIMWYFSPALDEAQSKSIAQPLSPMSHETSPSFNKSSGPLTGSGANDDILYPVEGTSITLEFYYLGLGLPRALVTAHLAGVLNQVKPFAKGPQENDTIRDNYFQQMTSGATTKIATTVVASDKYLITWKELFNALTGLHRFVIGINDSQTHFQTLGCRILDEVEGKIGIGTLSYYDPRTHVVERRAMTTGATITALPPPQTVGVTNTSLSLHDDNIAWHHVPWPVPRTDLTLTFTILGRSVPLIEILTLLGAARLTIARDVHDAPAQSIHNGSFRYENGARSLVVSIIAYMDKTITWLQLHEILFGLSGFYIENEGRTSEFEIDAAGHVRIGFGVILSDPNLSTQKAHKRRNLDIRSGRPEVVKRSPDPISFLPQSVVSTNILESQPLPTKTIPPQPTDRTFQLIASFQVTGTSITANIGHLFPTPIPVDSLVDMFDGAHLDIQGKVAQQPNKDINHGYFYHEMRTVEGSLVAFALNATAGNPITWLQLDQAMQSMKEFVNERRSYRHALVFQLNVDFMPGLFATGSVTFVPLTAPTLAARSALPPTRTSLTAPIPYPLPHTNMILRIMLLGTPVPTSRLAAVYNGAIREITPDVTAHPDEPFNKSFFLFEASNLQGRELTTIEVHPRVGEHLTWLQLFQILRGLQAFAGGETRLLFSQAISFKIDIERSYAAYGLLSYYFHPLRPTLDSSFTPSPAGTTSTAPLPYPIIGTPITLAFTILLPTYIPLARVINFFSRFHYFIADAMATKADQTINRYFTFYARFYATTDVMSIIVQRQPGKIVTYRQLCRIMDGLEDFMQGKWVASPHLQILFFEIEIFGEGVVATAMLTYTDSLSVLLKEPTDSTKSFLISNGTNLS